MSHSPSCPCPHVAERIYLGEVLPLELPQRPASDIKQERLVRETGEAGEKPLDDGGRRHHELARPCEERNGRRIRGIPCRPRDASTHRVPARVDDPHPHRAGATIRTDADEKRGVHADPLRRRNQTSCSSCAPIGRRTRLLLALVRCCLGDVIVEAMLRGYLLEETLAWLLRDSAYEFLTARDWDPELEGHGAKLQVRGVRGSRIRAD